MNQEKWQQALDLLVSKDDARLITSLSSCVHCGLCAESCMYYLAFQDDKLIPARKVEILRAIRAYHGSLQGRMLSFIHGARKMDEKTIEEMVDLFYGSCTMCNRCTAHCSIGVDFAKIIETGREMLAVMGYTPATLQSTVNTALKTGNNMGIPENELLDTIHWLEDDLRDDVGDPNASIPLNQKGKRILYTMNPREPKFFPLSISAIARIFYAAGESWTISTRMYDVTNYAFFSGNMDEAAIIARRMKEEMQEMGSQILVLGECGHGTRALRWEAPNYLGEPFPFETVTCTELLLGYIRDGKIKVDPTKIKDKLTLHDPCNLVRNGGIVKELRDVIHAVSSNFEEMTPHGIDNYCCGGGGGQLSMSEYNERRMKISGLKADQIRNTGATVVVTPCHNCVDQLIQTNQAYKLNVKIKTLAEVVSDALII